MSQEEAEEKGVKNPPKVRGHLAFSFHPCGADLLLLYILPSCPQRLGGPHVIECFRTTDRRLALRRDFVAQEISLVDGGV